MVEMNDTRSWAQGFRCYEQLKAFDDMKNYGLWDQGFKCFE